MPVSGGLVVTDMFRILYLEATFEASAEVVTPCGENELVRFDDSVRGLDLDVRVFGGVEEPGLVQ